MTISLLALVLAIVLPRIGVTPSLSETSRHLIGAIQSLYTAAAASNRTYRLNIDLDQRIYWVTVSTHDGDRLPSDPSLAFRTSLPSPLRFEDVTTGRQGKVTTGKVFIQFSPGWRADHAVIHLSDQADRRLAMVLNPLTGGVRVFDHYYMEPPKVSVSEGYRDFFKALPPPPVLPVQQALQASQVQQAIQP